MRTEPRFTRDLDLAVAVSNDGEAEGLVYGLQAAGFHALATVEQQETRRLATARLAPSGDRPDGLMLDLLFASSGIEAADVETDLRVWRGEAYNAWQAGVDGIYTFNRFNPRDPIFHEIGDPRRLERAQRIDQVSYVAENCWSKPETWVKNGRSYAKG